MYGKTITDANPKAEVIYPDDAMQILVTKGICNSKNTKRYLPQTNPDNPAHCFGEVCKWFEGQGCDTIVAGCTDIRNVFYMRQTNKLNYIDSLEVLAKAIVNISERP